MRIDRYQRQERIQGWSQEALSSANVMVAGAGALGNETIKNLALQGVGRLLVVDLDRIEISNLSRTVLFRETDLNRPKAKVAARRARELNPEIDVRFIYGNLFHNVGLGFYRQASLVIGCLDNLAARSQVGISCALAGVPYLDGGMWDAGGEVRWFLPGETACFECTLTDDDRQHATERRSCTGFKLEDTAGPRIVPTTINTAAIIGGLLSQEAAYYLCGRPVVGGEALVYNGLTGKMHRAALQRKTNCPHHSPYLEIEGLKQGATDLTAARLIKIAEQNLGKGTGTIVELGRAFLLSFHCSQCGKTESVNQVQATVAESRAICPKCGKMRQANTVSHVDSASLVSRRKLSKLGVPQGEILSVRNAAKMRLYELNCVNRKSARSKPATPAKTREPITNRKSKQTKM